MRNTFPPTFKSQVVQEMLKEEKTVGQLAAEYGVHVTQLHKWKKHAIEHLVDLFDGDRKAAEKQKEQEQKIQELYAEIGQLTTQLSWLKKKSGLHPDSR